MAFQPFGSFGIPNLRQKALMENYGSAPAGGGYDPSMDDFGYEAPDPSGYNVGEILSPYMRQQAPSAPPAMQTASPYATTKPPQKDLGQSIRETWDAVNQVYTPETVDRDRLRALMDAAPERQAPSFGRSLVAAGLSLKANDPVATSEAVMEAPNRRAMAEWLAKSDPFIKTAQLENTANINERTLAGNVANTTIQDRRIQQQQEEARGKQEVAEKRAETDRLYRNAMALKATGWSFDFSGTRIIATKPDGSKMDYGPTGEMDEYQKETLRAKARVEAAQAAGAAGMDRAVAAGTIAVVGPDGKLYPYSPAAAAGYGSKPAPAEPPEGSKPFTGKPEDPKDVETRNENQRVEIVNTDPQVSKWYRVQNGKVTRKDKNIPEVGSKLNPFGYSQSDVDDFWAATKKLYPNAKIGPTTSASPESKQGPMAPTKANAARMAAANAIRNTTPPASTPGLKPGEHGIGPALTDEQDKDRYPLGQRWLKDFGYNPSPSKPASTSKPARPSGPSDDELMNEVRAGKLAAFDKNGKFMGVIHNQEGYNWAINQGWSVGAAER